MKKTQKILFRIIITLVVMVLLPDLSLAQQTAPGYIYAYNNAGNRLFRIYGWYLYLKI